MAECALDAVDRAILNRLQRGFPVCERPYLEAAAELGLEEEALIARLQRLLQDGVLTRFGPMFQLERAGGAFVLAAMQVPEHDLERVVDIVNALPEVAHNYLREHRFNLWFVLATAAHGDIDRAVSRIEDDSGYPVYAMPKLREYFLGLHLPL
ncbi:MAG TPA: AsnC family transcriptional regulator [Burkholderiales bacterium]|nr:AsnC family transcriptional regulator [Burkholderiales bacterium]